MVWNSKDERKEVDTATDSLVHGAQFGLVIAGNKQFELGIVLKKVLAHEPCRDWIFTG